MKGEAIDKPFKMLKLGSVTSISWTKIIRKTKIEDEVITESNWGNEYDLKLLKIIEKIIANEI